MTVFKGPPSTATRNQPISPELRQVLDTAARIAEIEVINIVSGGQDALGQGNRRTGSTRHDFGRAADIQLFRQGKRLTFTDQAAHPAVLAFITAATGAGATGIGAGVGYMGDSTIHVGFGRSLSDTAKLTWGARGASATAPKWLRDAAQAGWAHPVELAPVLLSDGQGAAGGTHVVVARGGLKVRGGPGTDFGSERTLPVGTVVTVMATSDQDPAWVSVDVEGDRLLDGFVFAAYLAPVGDESGWEDAHEP